MNIKVVDNKRNEIIRVDIDINVNIFVVAPFIINPKFNYLKNKLMKIRKKYLDMYLNNKFRGNDYEIQIYNEIRDLLITEMERIHRIEGVMYYTE